MAAASPRPSVGAWLGWSRTRARARSRRRSRRRWGWPCCSSPGVPRPTAARPGRRRCCTSPTAWTARSPDSTPPAGAPSGPALPVGAAPRRLAPASDGSVLVLSQGAARGDALTHLTHLTPTGGPGGPGGAWAARPVPLPAPAPPAHATLLAGDGDRHAVVVLAGIGPDAPRLALVDARTGTVERTGRVPVASRRGRPLRGAGAHPRRPHRVPGTAGAGRPSGGARRGRRPGAHPGRARGDRRRAGQPRLSPAPPRTSSWPGSRAATARRTPTGRSAGCTPCCSAPGPGRADDREAQLAPQAWELLALDPATLVAQRTHPLDDRLTALAGSPDGRHLYALTQHLAVSPGAAVTRLLHLDLAGGSVRPLADVPGVALGLAVTRERVYVPNAFGAEVWAVDRRSGRRLQTIPVGQHPTDVSLAGALATTGPDD